MAEEAERDHYDVLGVPTDASSTSIKKAFRAAALEHHPDKGGDAAVFQTFQRAYEVLSDPFKRCLYDATRPMSTATRQARAEAAAAEQDRPTCRGSGPTPATDGRPWSQRRQRRQGRCGVDQIMAYPLTLEELYNGCVRPLAVERRIVCPSCLGSGAKPGHTLKECSLCGGEGAEGRQCEECGMRNWWGPAYVLDGPDRNAIVVAGPDGQHFIVPLPNKQKPSHPTVELQPCDSRCSQCHGAKLVKEKKTHTVLVEKGTDRGHRIVFEEASNEHPGTIPGDVILHIEEIGPHPRFIRKKHNLVHKRTVTADDAIAGFSFSLLHLDRRRINITAGPGQVTPPVSSLVVPGEGFPLYEQPLVKGDLIVIFVVEGDVLSGRPLSSLALDGMHIPEGNPQRRLCDAPSSVDALMKQLEAHEETSDERVLAARTASAQVIQAAWRRWRGRPGADDCDATCDLEPEPEPEPDPS